MQLARDCLSAHALINRGQRVGVAVSGGLDSMVLLHLLEHLLPELGVAGWVLHFNHLLRGKHSDQDAAFVARAARRAGWPVVLGRGDVVAAASASGQSIEMAARQLRHEFLAREAARRNLDRVALAHHADDQIELFFLRLLRGSGTGALSGMHWREPSPMNREITLIRPLLGVTRAEIRAYAKQAGLRWREDRSNRTLAPLRNRVRRTLVPLLERLFQPALRRVILRHMDRFRAEAEWIQGAARHWLGEEIQPGSFDDLPVALQRSCLQLQLIDCGIEPSHELVERLRLAPGVPVTVGSDRLASRDASGRIGWTAVAPTDFEPGAVQVSLTRRRGEVKLGRRTIRWSRSPVRGQVRPPSSVRVGRESFDADAVGDQVTLRFWRPGDRFRPLGFARASKLQNLFTNLKVPPGERRQRIVAVAAQGEIFWVEGLRIGERFKLDKRTVHRLNWRWT
jgi:tRNA(Ile)-lysidine synthase